MQEIFVFQFNASAVIEMLQSQVEFDFKCVFGTCMDYKKLYCLLCKFCQFFFNAARGVDSGMQHHVFPLQKQHGSELYPLGRYQISVEFYLKHQSHHISISCLYCIITWCVLNFCLQLYITYNLFITRIKLLHTYLNRFV